MKKIFLVISVMFLSCGVFFALTFRTGQSMFFFPESAPQVSSKGGDSSSCYIAKVAKAVGYPDGTYELQLVSADWIGASVFPVSFTYIVKKNDVLNMVVIAYGTPVRLLVTSVSDNEIELIPLTDSKTEEDDTF